MRLDVLFFPLLVFYSCGQTPTPLQVNEASEDPEVQLNLETPFGQDVAFLKSHDPELVLLSKDDTYLVASAKYQGKVFTTTNSKPERPSFGYINRKAFGLETPAEHINGYGSENRLWLGPEAGPQALFFKPDVSFEGVNWYTPSAIDHEPWTLVSKNDSKVSFEKEAEFVGRQGTTFITKIEREVELLGQNKIRSLYQYDTAVVGDLSVVGYMTKNTLINAGDQPWTKESGTICLWLLDMLPAGDKVTIILPFETPQANPLKKIKRYFGEVAEDRLGATSNAVHFRGDGKSVGKIGIPPQMAGNRLGSLDLENNILTLVFADVDPKATYLAMEWRDDVDPFVGDAMTSYNDRGENDGTDATFYEMETIAPAAFLAPGEKSVHIHNIYHFTGPQEDLIAAAKELLGYDPAVLD